MGAASLFTTTLKRHVTAIVFALGLFPRIGLGIEESALGNLLRGFYNQGVSALDQFNKAKAADEEAKADPDSKDKEDEAAKELAKAQQAADALKKNGKSTEQVVDQAKKDLSKQTDVPKEGTPTKEANSGAESDNTNSQSDSADGQGTDSGAPATPKSPELAEMPEVDSSDTGSGSPASPSGGASEAPTAPEPPAPRSAEAAARDNKLADSIDKMTSKLEKAGGLDAETAAHNREVAQSLRDAQTEAQAAQARTETVSYKEAGNMKGAEYQTSPNTLEKMFDGKGKFENGEITRVNRAGDAVEGQMNNGKMTFPENEFQKAKLDAYDTLKNVEGIQKGLKNPVSADKMNSFADAEKAIKAAKTSDELASALKDSKVTFKDPVHGEIKGSVEQLQKIMSGQKVDAAQMAKTNASGQEVPGSRDASGRLQFDNEANRDVVKFSDADARSQFLPEFEKQIKQKLEDINNLPANERMQAARDMINKEKLSATDANGRQVEISEAIASEANAIKNREVMSNQYTRQAVYEKGTAQVSAKVNAVRSQVKGGPFGIIDKIADNKAGQAKASGYAGVNGAQNALVAGNGNYIGGSSPYSQAYNGVIGASRDLTGSVNTVGSDTFLKVVKSAPAQTSLRPSPASLAKVQTTIQSATQNTIQSGASALGNAMSGVSGFLGLGR